MKATHRVAAVVCLVAVIGVSGCAPRRPLAPDSTRPATGTRPLPPFADGIAFVRDGVAFVVRDGSAHEVAADGIRKVAVGYSADGGSLLVTEERGSQRIVLMLPAGASGKESVVLDSADGSALGAVRVVPRVRKLYYSVYGDPANHLVTTALTAASEQQTPTLQGTFSGEFDVDVSGGSIVYTGSGQNPATVMLRTGGEFRPLATGMATVFTPAFSRRGGRVCFTGSERAGDPIAVWVVEPGSDEPRIVGGTASLKPTFPVFSPDGTSVAFRSAADGSIWIVPLGGGEPQDLALTADEAPIGW
jgi:hypothetical protein